MSGLTPDTAGEGVTRSVEPGFMGVRLKRWTLLVGGGAWLLVVIVGTLALFRYSVTAGTPSSPPERWPAHSVLAPPSHVATLVMVVHPQCSCTRASIGELARLMLRLEGRLAAHVLFVRPSGTASDWTKTDLWTSAEGIPGVRVVEDAEGSEAELFGANTSGASVLYSADGQLLFHGGITPTRSHFGDSVGSRRIIELVSTGDTDRDESDVYGCALQEPLLEPSAGQVAP